MHTKNLVMMQNDKIQDKDTKQRKQRQIKRKNLDDSVKQQIKVKDAKQHHQKKHKTDQEDRM